VSSSLCGQFAISASVVLELGKVQLVKIGDLVTLSAYGKSLKMFECIDRDDVGLIYHMNLSSFFVRWCKSGKRTWKERLVRKDVKYAKKTF